MEQDPQSHSDHSSEETQPTPTTTLPTIYTDPLQYLTWCKSDKKIKIMDEMNPLLNNVYLKDISLHKKGPLEDKIYSKTPKYYWNIRRGNTLCEVYEGQKRTQLFFCRRGMIKFFDMEAKFLQGNKAHLTYREGRFRRVIFERLDQSLEEGGYRFHLYSLFKENGQHCQISYIKQLGAWIVASKNVAILVRDQSDIEAYQKERFYWAKLIATEFLLSIEAMTPEKLEQFKVDIEDKTLIGEHCGHQKHQHITKYHKVQIIYYAVVENSGSDSCLPVDQAFALFDKYNLKKVQTNCYMNLTNQTQVYEKIYALMKEIATGSMDEVGEGSVLYIVAQKDNFQRTISLSKLKSAEYLIFRKLREMLKINLSKKGETANTLSKFRFQVQQIVKEMNGPPFPLEYYYRIAESAFKEVEGKFEEMEEGELRYKFVTFLEAMRSKKMQVVPEEVEFSSSRFSRIVVVCLPKTLRDGFGKQYREKGIKVEDVFREGVEAGKETLSIVHMIPRVTDAKKHQRTLFVVCDHTEEEMQVTVDRLNLEKQPFNQSIVSFIRAPDKEKQLALLCGKISGFFKVCDQNNLHFRSVSGDNKEEQIKEIIDSEFVRGAIEKERDREREREGPKRYVIILLLLPGSGKTLLSQGLLQSKLNIKVLESDRIRREVYKELQQKSNSQLTNQELFQQAKVATKERYLQEVSKILEQPFEEDEFLFVDRVVAPTNMEQIEVFQREKHRFVFVMQGGYSWRSDQSEYPISLTYLLNCFKRCIEREGHQVLESDPIATCKVLLKFYQMFKGWKPNLLEKRYPNSKIIRLQFVEDMPDDDTNLSNSLKSRIKECLKLVTRGMDPQDLPSFEKLVLEYYSSAIPVRNPDPKTLTQSFITQLLSFRSN